MRWFFLLMLLGSSTYASSKVQTILEVDGKKHMWPSFILKKGKWGTFRKRGFMLRVSVVEEGPLSVRIKTQIIDTSKGSHRIISQPGFTTRWGRTAEIYQTRNGEGTLRLRIRPIRIKKTAKRKQRRRKRSSISSRK